jgi:primosomal protein N' (replication factor Y)
LTTTSKRIQRIADIVVPGPFEGALSYLIEPGQQPLPGSRCQVPLRSREVTGVVTRVREAGKDDSDKLKSILTVLDARPLVSPDVLQLARWVSRYYLYDAHPAYMLALPSTLRAGEAAELNDEPLLELTVAGRHLEPAQLKGRRQQEALAVIQSISQQEQPCSPASLKAQGIERAHWKGLIQKRLLVQQPARLLPASPSGKLKQVALTLNADQQLALAQLPLEGFAVQLLEGVTGSGKTEVYLQAMQRTLAQGKRVLVLVPEIGLTPQTLSRFQQRFQDSLVALHSGLTDKQRHNAWLRAEAGEASIILGTRSAVLTPIPDLGLIVVDEEHDASYKQQDTLRYHARDLAIYRARLLNIPVILGSATPSLESLHNAQQGRYLHQTLQQRASGQHRARLETIDMRKQTQQHGVSERLLHRVREHLDGGNQVLLFLNRRGYAPSWFCRQCGWMSDCPFCDARLTYHRGRHQMLCHHCGHQERPPQQCPDCGSTDLTPLGAGTERAEEALTDWFPDTPIIRFDRDSVANARDLEQQLARAHADGPAILVGTQMLAKGHHFDRVTLVGIIDMDAGLFSADFRARERMGQLLVQVSGRSGRGERAGEVVLQTFHPDHPFFTPLLMQDYPAFAAQLLTERQRSGLPPYGFLACLRSDSAYPQRAEQLLKEMAQRLLNEPGIRVFGPLPALLSRRAGKHRFTLLVQSDQRSRLHTALQPLVADYPRQQRHVSWHLDIDPIDLM